MDRTAFLAHPDVRNFVVWLQVELPRLVVHLRFPKSRFVDDGLNHKVVSIEKVHALYCWGMCGTTKRARYFALARMLFDWRILQGL